MHVTRLIPVSLAAFLFSCSSSSSTPATTDAGSSGNPEPPPPPPAEAGAPLPVNACTIGKNYKDHSAAGDSRTLEWDFSIAQSPDRCMTIKAGQSVTWSTSGGPPDFTTHPLAAAGGNTPNPITDIDTTTGKVTFPKAGVYGYQCGNHPAMTGAIQVK
jgi:plastocyanin